MTLQWPITLPSSPHSGYYFCGIHKLVFSCSCVRQTVSLLLLSCHMSLWHGFMMEFQFISCRILTPALLVIYTCCNCITIPPSQDNIELVTQLLFILWQPQHWCLLMSRYSSWVMCKTAIFGHDFDELNFPFSLWASHSISFEEVILL